MLCNTLQCMYVLVVWIDRWIDGDSGGIHDNDNNNNNNNNNGNDNDNNNIDNNDNNNNSNNSNNEVANADASCHIDREGCPQ